MAFMNTPINQDYLFQDGLQHSKAGNKQLYIILIKYNLFNS